MLSVAFSTFGGLLLLSALFFCLERFFNRCDAQPAFGWRDVSLNKIFYLSLQMIFSATGVAWIFLGFLRGLDVPWVSWDLPLAVKVVSFFFFFDMFLYFCHRFLMHGPFWRFHIVHHMDKRVVWLTFLKTHPVEILCLASCRVSAAFVSGIPLELVQSLMVVEIVTSAFAHSNIYVRLGPLDRIFFTPQYHRLHHCATEAERERNYGFLFTFWDRAWGTYAAPSSESHKDFSKTFSKHL